MIRLDMEQMALIDGYINSPVRSIKAKIEMYQYIDDAAVLVDTFTHDGDLISFKIDRAGDENKFFGFGIIQKINIKLIDTNREKNITTNNYFKIYYNIDGIEFKAHPTFYTTEVHRDENTNELSITAYDILYQASKHTVEELIPHLPEDTYNPVFYLQAAAAVLGAEWSISNIRDTGWIDISKQPNYEGVETLKDFFDDMAELSATIYFVNCEDKIQYTMLRENNSIILDKNNYIDLDSKTNRRLAAIIHATELGENIGTVEISGSTQYIRDNPFLEVLDGEEVATILNNTIEIMGGLTINQFTCSWRGNPLTEPGDALWIFTKDDNDVYSYLINDVIEYNGTYKQKTQWNYTNEDIDESYNNPTTLGEALKQTFAKVDKVNHQIDLVVRTVAENDEAANGRMDEIEKEVALKLTQDDVKIEITSAIDNIKGITTTTGYKFDEDGLTISKSDTDITTTITENGMKVSQGSNEKLVANADGVKAKDLKATTYLIIGNNSRFEDYTTADGKSRTACFWIGG